MVELIIRIICQKVNRVLPVFAVFSFTDQSKPDINGLIVYIYCTFYFVHYSRSLGLFLKFSKVITTTRQAIAATLIYTGNLSVEVFNDNTQEIMIKNAVSIISERIIFIFGVI